MGAVGWVPGPHELVEGAVVGEGLGGGGAAGVMRFRVGDFGGGWGGWMGEGGGSGCGDGRSGARRGGDAVGDQGGEGEEEESEEDEGGEEEGVSSVEWLFICVVFKGKGFLLWGDGVGYFFVRRAPVRKYVEHVVAGKHRGNKRRGSSPGGRNGALCTFW